MASNAFDMLQEEVKILKARFNELNSTRSLIKRDVVAEAPTAIEAGEIIFVDDESSIRRQYAQLPSGLYYNNWTAA